MSDQGVAVGQLRAFVERVERVEEEIKTLNDDKSEIYKEMRGFGFDVKAVRKVVAKRKLDPSVRDEQDAMFDLYWDALTGSVHVHTPAREIIEEFDAKTGEILDHAPLPEMSEIMDMDAPDEPKPVKAKTNAKRPSKSDKPSPEAGPQAEASHVGTDTGMLADREGRHEGEAVSADLPTNSPEPASQFTPPSFLVRKSISDFRPHCQKPDACGASGLKHCYSCSKLIPAESEAA